MAFRAADLLGLFAGLTVWLCALVAVCPEPTQPQTLSVRREIPPIVFISASGHQPESTTIRGRVVDSEGQPVAGSAIIVCPFSLFMPPIPGGLLTDAEGRFELSGLAPGRYSLVAIHGQYPPGAVAAIPVFAEKETPRLSSVEVEIVLDRDLVLEA